ncbi:hypothetical protein AX15_004024 [Amanita polypyramis BW_CC]|nr:hypothetical protein AX15_004024 [Amanita polypyramis BW_CC]
MQADWDLESSDDEQPASRSQESSPRWRSRGHGNSILPILNNLFSMQSGGAPSGPRMTVVSARDLSRLLVDITPLPVFDGDGDGDGDDDEDDEYYDESEYYHASPDVQQWYPPHKEPQVVGVELLASGDFGRVSMKDRARMSHRNVAKRHFTRPNQHSMSLYKEDLTSNLVPNSNGTAVASIDANIYSGQYSTDSTFYYTCSQDFRLHIFDTTKPPDLQLTERPGVVTKMPIKKSIQGQHGRWTITDANLSPDNERLIYSSITPTAYMTSVSDDSMQQTPIPFGDRGSWEGSIWSCRFSADGNEVVAGGSGNIFVYDLIANRRTVKIKAHGYDVNSCCWADTASGNVLISASDDTFLKVWDRRSLGSSPKPSGVLIGHTEGLTYVSAKGDGRYVISNGKDQAMRLWDLRKMRTNNEFESVRRDGPYGTPGFDYRYQVPRKPRYPAHPMDCSIMTYRGHSVLKTLIRCHFSPAETTGSQYLYSGSADGRIHIWSLDGTVVQILDRTRTLPISFDPSEPEPGIGEGTRLGVCVRDVSWHSQEPVLMSAAWESRHDGSVVARHEWKGLMKIPGALEDWNEKARLEREERLEKRKPSCRVPGAFDEDED